MLCYPLQIYLISVSFYKVDLEMFSFQLNGVRTQTRIRFYYFD